VNQFGMGIMGAVDDGCNCFVTIDGGYEITDFESKQSDDISMSAIMMICEGEYVYVSEGMCVRLNKSGCQVEMISRR
jgi:hypothetical protein